MKTKHTPGPWTYSNQGADINDHDVEIWNQNTHVATLNQYHPHHEVNDEANAQLIAAAPELFEALKETWAQVDTSKLTPETILKIKAALKKATGGVN